MAKQKSVLTKTSPKPALEIEAKSINIGLIVSSIIMLFCYTNRLLDPVLMSKYMPFLTVLIIGTVAVLRSKESVYFFSLLKSNLFFGIYALFLLFSGLSFMNSTLIGDAIFEWSKMLMSLWGLALVVFYYRTHKNADFREDTSKIIGVFTLIACLIAVFQLVQMSQNKKVSHENLYTISALFSHRNIFCEVLFLCLPFNIYGVLYENGTWKRINQVAGMLSLLLIVGLLSRSIWIALLISSFVTFCVYLLMEYPNWKQAGNASIRLTQMAKWVGGVVAFLGFIIFCYSIIDSGDTIKKLIDSIVNVHYYSNEDRLQKWQHSLTIFQENPLLGTGMGDWKIDIMAFPAKGTECEYGKLLFQRPHNDYLWVLSESGILAFAAFMGIFAIVIFQIIKTVRIVEEEKNRISLYLYVFGIIGYMVFSAFSFPKERMEDLFLLHLLFAGVLLAQSPKEAFVDSTYSKPILMFVGLTLLFCFFVGWQRTQGELLLRKYQRTKDKKQVNEAINYAQNAIKPFYLMDPISTPIAYFTGSAYLQSGRAKESLPFLKEAYDLTPNHVQVINNLAGAYYFLKDKEAAEKLYEKAIMLAPKYSDALISLAVVNLEKKNIETDWKAFEMVCAIDSSSKDTKYLNALKGVQQELSQHLLIEDTLFHTAMLEAINNKSFFFKAFYHRRGTKTSLEKQLKAETLYHLYETKKITESEWAAMKKKYNCEM